MKIIIDACTVILLAKASVFEILLENYEVKMTKYVYEEVIEGKEKMFKDALLVEKLKQENKIKFIETNNIIMKKLAKDFNMGDGEASTISTAIKEQCIVMTDNLQGRKATQINSLPLLGSIEVIVQLFRNGKIDYKKSVEGLKILREEGWFDPNLIEKAREDIENGRS